MAQVLTQFHRVSDRFLTRPKQVQSEFRQSLSASSENREAQSVSNLHRRVVHSDTLEVSQVSRMSGVPGYRVTVIRVVHLVRMLGSFGPNNSDSERLGWPREGLEHISGSIGVPIGSWLGPIGGPRFSSASSENREFLSASK